MEQGGSTGTAVAHPGHPQLPFHRPLFQPLIPQPGGIQGSVVTQGQDLALAGVEPHSLGPSIQPVPIPLQSPPANQRSMAAADSLDALSSSPIMMLTRAGPALSSGGHHSERMPPGSSRIPHHCLGLAIQAGLTQP